MTASYTPPFGAGQGHGRVAAVDDLSFRHTVNVGHGQIPRFDADLGRHFLDLRLALELGLWDMARLVGSEPTVIANLEAGALDQLPQWPELSRIIEAYGAETGVDMRPIISRLLVLDGYVPPNRMQPSYIPQTQVPSSQPPIPPVPAMPPPPVAPRPLPVGLVDYSQPAPPPVYSPRLPIEDAVIDAEPLPQLLLSASPLPVGRQRHTSVANGNPRGRLSDALEDTDGIADVITTPRLDYRGWHLNRTVLSISLAALCLVASLLAARMAPGALYAVASPWPRPLSAPLKAGVDALVEAMAPVRDGLKWIDAGDPKWRKADKLPEAVE